MARRLMIRGFAPGTLVQVLNFIPHRPESLTLTRGCGGPQRSVLDKGRGAQHNEVGTIMSIEEKPVASNQKDNSSSQGNDQLNDINDNTVKSSSQ